LDVPSKNKQGLINKKVLRVANTRANRQGRHI